MSGNSLAERDKELAKMKDFVFKNKEIGDDEVNATYRAILDKAPKTQVSIMGVNVVQSYELEQMQVLAKLVDCKRVLTSRLANTNNPEEKKALLAEIKAVD